MRSTRKVMASMLLALALAALCAFRSNGDTVIGKYAVIVGINDYNGAAPTLRYAVSDATRVYKTLTDPRFGNVPKDHVVLLTSDATGDTAKPTAANVIHAVEDIAHKTGKDDQFWFYFAGHGIELHDYSYLVTQGFSLQDMDHTAVSTHQLREILAKECKATQKILVLDACESGSARRLEVVREGGSASGSPTSPQPPASPGSSDGNTITLTACKINQSAYEFDDFHDGSGGGGVFTYFLVNGLQGAADVDHDGLVSAAEIRDFIVNGITHKMSQDVFAQTPQFIARDPGRLNSIYLTHAATTAAARSFDIDDAHLQTKHPLPPTLIVLLSKPVENGQAAPATEAENEVIDRLMKKGFLIADTQAAAVLHNLVGDQQIAQAAAKRGAHFLVVGQVNTSINTVEAPLQTAVTTISARIVDEQGNILATAKAVSDPHAATTASEAESAAVAEAASKFVHDLVTSAVQKALGN